MNGALVDRLHESMDFHILSSYHTNCPYNKEGELYCISMWLVLLVVRVFQYLGLYFYLLRANIWHNVEDLLLQKHEFLQMRHGGLTRIEGRVGKRSTLHYRGKE